ncbi:MULTISPECIES: ABC transporter ATP-binding protein [unclassified Sporolactobacillus]|uniref:ABC transporter ATP-binding protein n=1 Tax=unclassified Sporolactobacillus TaxID=2628533 RepID=UPI002367A965|nr:ABC transporter ATP-binding protein [Sporolactobacillus sp. CQH2019]MDD9148355.1 ABC transporter ATP-binding protein [Sporolactobacillus sp. CQH2019]
MSEPVISAKELTKRYGSRAAVENLTLNVGKGRVLGVLGANGAGKSTFFRMIVGLVRPDNGQIEVLGKEPGWRSDAEIAYLPDRARWYSDYTADQGIEWGSRFLPGFDREEAGRLAEIMRLPRDLKASEMSKGQEARLMLILCMARRVPLVILDEPFSGIDGSSREHIIDVLIDALSEKQQTLLISTHEIYEAEGLFDDVVFLRQGRVALSGEAESLRRQYGSIDALSKKLYREEER